MSEKRKWVIEYYPKELWGVEIEADNKEHAIELFLSGEFCDSYRIGDSGELCEIDSVYEVDENGDKV